MKRVLFDTNVLLDILLKRDPFYAVAAELWLRIESGDIEGLVSLPSLATIFYVVGRCVDEKTARQALNTMCRTLRIAEGPAEAGHMALRSRQPDFEDALQYAIAVLAKADCLVTRNPSDFPKHGRLPVMTPDKLLQRLGG